MGLIRWSSRLNTSNVDKCFHLFSLKGGFKIPDCPNPKHHILGSIMPEIHIKTATSISNDVLQLFVFYFTETEKYKLQMLSHSSISPPLSDLRSHVTLELRRLINQKCRLIRIFLGLSWWTDFLFFLGFQWGFAI